VLGDLAGQAFDGNKSGYFSPVTIRFTLVRKKSR